MPVAINPQPIEPNSETIPRPAELPRPREGDNPPRIPTTFDDYGNEIPVAPPPPPTPTDAFAFDAATLGPGAQIGVVSQASPGQASGTADAQGQATAQNIANFSAAKDWRVRVSLAPGATYLYNASEPGILKPLQSTAGVIFPYTPQISVSYSASYDAADLTHSNFRIFFYRNSQVGDITITGDFTAQDTAEADYVLAVIHFFRTATKMFYGQDQNPTNGTPPPLLYLSGYGAYQFDNHPMLITNFTMTLPDTVDYIRTSSEGAEGGVGFNLQSYQTPVRQTGPKWLRLATAGLQAGAKPKPPQFSVSNLGGYRDNTYIPTKMSISITCMPVVTRNDIANTFSVREYATGKLLQGSRRQGGGIW